VNNDIFTIGWIGSPSTQSYLEIIHAALQRISKTHKVKLRVIGIPRYTIEGVDVECEKWSELYETKLLSEIDLGVMPLPNNPFEKGKCGYKIIQYGASHKPSIASSVGVNKQIISHGLNGYLADTTEDWVAYMSKLINDKALRSQVGINARINVEKNYSSQINGKILEDVILSVV
jgi:glycosyltransferase involved in cell wall biosynthesis